MSRPTESSRPSPLFLRWLKGETDALTPAQEYLVAALAVAVVTGCGFIIRPWSDYWAVAVLYLFMIVLLSLRIGQGPILGAAALAALTWDFLFFPPLFTFMLDRFEDWMMFGLFFAIALVTGRFTGRIRLAERSERQRARRATALYELTRTLASAQSADEVLRHATEQVQAQFGTRLALLTADPADPDRLVLHPAATYAISAAGQEAALAAFRADGGSGAGTWATDSARRFFPLEAAGRRFGVMAVETDSTASPADVLDGFAAQIALALEHERLRAVSEAARVQAASDQLHRSLLDSVSHELKTPLAVIASAAESLQTTVPAPDRPLVGEIHVAAQRLRRLVDNLLDTTRLDSGGLDAQLDWCDLSDLINAALKTTQDIRHGRRLHLQIPTGLPLVRCDFDLIQQALANLIHNACRHTPFAAEITVSAGVDEAARRVWLAVADTGPGLREDQLARLFERFFRGEPRRPGGLGLGLSIARGFAEAHGGALRAENQRGGGARFVILLPFETHDNVPAE